MDSNHTPKQTIPLWKWIMELVLGSILFAILYDLEWACRAFLSLQLNVQQYSFLQHSFLRCFRCGSSCLKSNGVGICWAGMPGRTSSVAYSHVDRNSDLSFFAIGEFSPYLTWTTSAWSPYLFLLNPWFFNWASYSTLSIQTFIFLVSP